MKFNFNELALSKKLILGSGALAIISLFLPWVDLGKFTGGFLSSDMFGPLSQNGFQQDGYLLLAAFIYPIYTVFKQIPLHKIFGFVSSGAGVLATIMFINSTKADFFGQSISAAGSGLYLFLVSTILLTGFIFWDLKNDKVL